MKHIDLCGYGRSASRRRVLGLAVLAAAALCLAACGSSHAPAGAGAAPGTTHTADAVSVNPTSSQTPGALPSGGSAATASAATKPTGPAPTRTGTKQQTTVTSSNPCDQQVLLSYISTQVTNMPTGVQQVKIYNCVKGFARLYAVANPTSAGSQPDGNEFFLQYTADQWHVLASGNSLDCGDNNPKLTEACAAFG